MAWQVLENEELQCKPLDPDTSFSAADNSSEHEIGVQLADSDGATIGVPTVQKLAADGIPYGKFVVWDDTVKELTVATGGIQTFTKSSASVSADIGKGIIGDASNTVKTSSGTARGMVIARNGTTLYVDMRVGLVTNA